LHAPYFQGASLFLHTPDLRHAGARALVELALSGGEVVLRGVADVGDARPAVPGSSELPGLQLTFASVDRISDALLAELEQLAVDARPRVTTAMHALATAPSSATAGRAVVNAPAPRQRHAATLKLGALPAVPSIEH